MKVKLIALIVVLAFSQLAKAGVEHLLPKPQQITQNSSSAPFALDKVLVNAPELADEFREWIVTECAGVIVNSSETGTIEVQMVPNITGAEFQEEAYNLTVASNKVLIQATTRQGAYWALQTLKQLVNGTPGAITIPACAIVDWPAFRIRGYMQDIGRSYMDFEEVKKEIANLSRYKINVFHWHLTENQGWRLESKLFPQLNAAASYTRHPGKYYTMAQARELVQWCTKHGVSLIPEIDMPGHSAAFTRAFGYNMQTTQGLATMKTLVTEIIDSCFSKSPILHIGTDEVTMTMANFIPEMVSLIRAKGPKIGTWRRGYNGFNASDVGMCQLWAQTAPLAGVPNVESNYHYMNHFDTYADVVGMYNTSILDVAKQTADYAGVIMAIWNDRQTKTDRDIVLQNNLYPSVLAIAERAWLGGGTYIRRKGVMLDAQNTEGFRNFADWERRFLYHKANHLKSEPISYVKQANIQWRITDAFPNAGTLTAAFPPETTQTPTLVKDTCTINGVKYASRKVTGAGIYLRHVWGASVIPAFYANPVANSTAYAYTWVYSPIAQTVGANIEFQNYGRSESDIPPRQGTWDYKGSRIWLNDTEIMPPTWESQHTAHDNEILLTNENSSVRPPIAVQLVQGWNKVFLKLPVGAFSISQVRLVKWSFSCVFVTLDGKNAVADLIYSPEKNLNPSADVLISAIDEANLFRNTLPIGTQPGEYLQANASVLDAALIIANSVKNDPTAKEDQYGKAVVDLSLALSALKKTMNLPLASSAQTEIWYALYAPLRGNRYVAYKGDNAALVGEAYAVGADRQLWKFTKLADDSYAIVNKTAKSYISPNSTNPNALFAQAGTMTTGGWGFVNSLDKTFIVTSGAVQFNQANTGAYNILNWGGGTNTTDTGCRYIIKEMIRTSPTSLNNPSLSSTHIWAENGRVLIAGNDAKPELFALDGRRIDGSKVIQPGIVIVKVPGVVQKIIVR